MNKNIQEVVSSHNTEEKFDPSVIEKKEIKSENQFDIDIISLNKWFSGNTNLNNFSKLKLTLTGIDPEYYLLLLKTTDKIKNGESVRELFLFKDAGNIPVLNCNAIDMNIYNNNTYLITYKYEDVFIKTYGTKTGLICTFCANIQDLLIPCIKIKVKKNKPGIKIPKIESSKIEEKLKLPCDKEELILRYRQIQKESHDVTTLNDAVKLLISKQSNVFDINHKIQIDDVILSMLKLT